MLTSVQYLYYCLTNICTLFRISAGNLLESVDRQLNSLAFSLHFFKHFEINISKEEERFIQAQHD